MACHTPPLKYLFKVPHGYIKALKWQSASHIKRHALLVYFGCHHGKM